MKRICLLFAVGLLVVGCARFQHSESINVDANGATGLYQDVRSGKLHRTTVAGGGGAGGYVVGLGGLFVNVISDQSQSDPRNFAKAVATADLAKKIKSVRYDESTGMREYEFVQPLAGAASAPGKSSSVSPSFGREPVQ
jgi:hypothetical protein